MHQGTIAGITARTQSSTIIRSIVMTTKYALRVNTLKAIRELADKGEDYSPGLCLALQYFQQAIVAQRRGDTFTAEVKLSIGMDFMRDVVADSSAASR